MELELSKIINNQDIRKGLAYESHRYFFSIYFNRYITYESADFHNKIFEITEEENIKNALVMTFRGSGKSTILTTSYPIWAVIGKPKKKFVVIISQTQRQARQHLENIKKELESNPLLRDDLGPFKEVSDRWGSMSLTINNFNAKITAVSMEQTIRGMKYMNHRPDLIICDDIEDLSSMKTQENRDKIFDWITGEIIPSGDIGTKIIFVGNFLHEDSPIMRIKSKIESKAISGISLEVPLLNDENDIAWPGKYPDMESIEEEKKKVMDDYAWNREYLLKIIPKDSQIIKPEWIKYYDNLPIGPGNKIHKILIGVDLAISQSQNSDSTAIVPVAVFNSKQHKEVYVLPGIINSKLTYKDTLDSIRSLHNNLKNLYGLIPLSLIEKNGYQQVVLDQIKNMGIRAEGMTTSAEKSERLNFVSILFQEGKVFFPRKTSDILVRQLTNFGSEKHDDLADALMFTLEHTNKNKGRGFATTDDQGNVVSFLPSDPALMTKEQKIDYYKRLQDLNDRNFFL